MVTFSVKELSAVDSGRHELSDWSADTHSIILGEPHKKWQPWIAEAQRLSKNPKYKQDEIA